MSASYVSICGDEPYRAVYKVACVMSSVYYFEGSKQSRLVMKNISSLLNQIGENREPKEWNTVAQVMPLPCFHKKKLKIKHRRF